jgi:alkylation response protein AidB-like acyl-CoA dehydrogenase
VRVDLVEAAEGVHELVEAHADKAEQGRRLPKRLVQVLRDAQLFRMCVPAVYGGPEADPITMVRAIEAVATADGAAGWCTMIASTTSSMSLFMEPEWAQRIYGDPKSITGGVFAPNGRAVVDGDGWSVTGRWQWGSGTQHCNWITGGALSEDGQMHLMFFEAADVSIHDTWYSSGLRGTGSNDFSVDSAPVPRGRSVQPMAVHRYVDCALAAFPNFSLLAAGVASVSLGIARHAIDEFIELGQGKQPQFSSRTISESGATQAELAKAEAGLRSARAFLHDELN